MNGYSPIYCIFYYTEEGKIKIFAGGKFFAGSGKNNASGFKNISSVGNCKGFTCVLFNKKLKADLAIPDDFYQKAKDGEWTLDYQAKLAQDFYQDKNGNNRTAFEVVANNVQFVESKRDGASAPMADVPASFSNAGANEFVEIDNNSDDDLPF